MRILLLGEYSNVHNTLARGLHKLGHEVTVASDGDGWKNYPRDVDTKRKSFSFWGSLCYIFKLIKIFRSFKGYDIVQIINPEFVSLKAGKIYPFYKYLRKNNKRIILGAYGMDYYYIKGCLDFQTFRYSDFNMGKEERHSLDNTIFKRDWLYGDKGTLNKQIVKDCDGIVAGLYEYKAAYKNHCPFPEKVNYIPFPIVLPQTRPLRTRIKGEPLKLFIGIQTQRSAYKGTDIMLKAAQRLVKDFPQECTLQIAENIPFKEYQEMLNSSEVILDQLYSYTPAMNALEGMAHGLINVGGAEPENYELLGESELRPIINVQPSEESVYNELLYIIKNRDELIPKLQTETRLYLEKYHDHIKVAKLYADLYSDILNSNQHYV